MYVYIYIYISICSFPAWQASEDALSTLPGEGEGTEEEREAENGRGERELLAGMNKKILMNKNFKGVFCISCAAAIIGNASSEEERKNTEKVSHLVISPSSCFHLLFMDHCTHTHTHTHTQG